MSNLEKLTVKSANILKAMHAEQDRIPKSKNEESDWAEYEKLNAAYNETQKEIEAEKATLGYYDY